MDKARVQACREWIARRTAQLDQREKQYKDQYPSLRPEHNLERLNDLEATRFWVDIHRWELDKMIETDVEDYPQRRTND